MGRERLVLTAAGTSKPSTVAAALSSLDEGWFVRDVARGAGVKTCVVRRWMRAATLEALA